MLPVDGEVTVRLPYTTNWLILKLRTVLCDFTSVILGGGCLTVASLLLALQRHGTRLKSVLVC